MRMKMMVEIMTGNGLNVVKEDGRIGLRRKDANNKKIIRLRGPQAVVTALERTIKENF